MKSRSLLWLALGAIGLPLLSGGTGGCSFGSPIGTPVVDNAYTCGCLCGAEPRRATVQIAVNSDDVEQIGSTMELGGSDLDIGAHVVGLRFRNVQLPPNAYINTAIVQFRARENGDAATNVTIVGELSTDAQPFGSANNNLTSRTPTSASVSWTPGTWVAGRAGDAERTPNLIPIISELVNQPGWSTGSAVVLRIAGTGLRLAFENDLDHSKAAVLTIDYSPAIQTSVPVCATPEVMAQAVNGVIPQEAAAADCLGRVTANMNGLTSACGYPVEGCVCGLVIPNEGDASYDKAACDSGSCASVQTNGTCSNFDPSGYWACIVAGGTEASCAPKIAANTAPGGAPVCLAIDGVPGMAARLLGNHRTCEVDGTSHIEVGDREPTHDPDTTGTVDILGDPCPGGGCAVSASLGLAMEPVTFSVRFASDPMFYDLSASGETSFVTLSGQDAVFAQDTVFGTGNGRRGGTSLAIASTNDEPLVLGVDWTGRSCDLNGNLATTVDGETPDGTCADGTTPCTVDTDCADDNVPCTLEQQDLEEMTVDVALSGYLVNQPPSVNAGADQTIECTSTAGASFTLTGTASDADQNIGVTSWRSGSRVGAQVGQTLVLGQSLGVGAEKTYVLKAVDTYAAADEDDTKVKVVDTTPPVLSVSVSPARMSKENNHKLVLVTATITATDTCDASPDVRLVSIASSEPDNGTGDGDQPNDVQGAVFNTDDRQFLLRNERSGKGRGRIYTITYSATDDTGNKTTQQATVTVPNT
jgi:hypothetical protein